jgi:predicted double-glycine peptidase
MLLEFVATVLLGILGWRMGYRLGQWMLRRGATANDLFKGSKVLVVVVLLFYLGVLVVAVNLPQWQGLPLTWRVYGMQVSWTIVRVLLLGACGLGYAICQKTARHQLVYVTIVGVLGLVCFTVVEGYFIAPIHGQLTNHLKPNGIYRQTSDSSCAPAALATLLQRWQLPQATESEVARLAGTSRMGTSMPQILRAARSLGMDGRELSPTWEQMRQMNRPGILSVWQFAGMRRLPHAVALMAMTADKAIVADPAIGKYIVWNRQEFKRVWRQEFLPIYRSGEAELSWADAQDYLQKLGYRDRDVISAVKRFQMESGLKTIGKLDEATVLMLTGKSLKQLPTLDERQFNQDVMRRMNCGDNPQRCPW